jgi:hypothetical protein
MAENREFYVKYLDNQAVAIDTSYGRGPQGSLALLTVAHLIGAFQARPGSLLANTDAGLITLHLPEGTAKDCLEEDCFANVDESDTTLDPGCPLSNFGSIGAKSKEPLIIKSRNPSLMYDRFLLIAVPCLKVSLARIILASIE